MAHTLQVSLARCDKKDRIPYRILIKTVLLKLLSDHFFYFW